MSRTPSRLLAVASVAALGLGVIGIAGPASAGTAPVVTRAALDPALVAGRGADVDFLEQEAENAATNGTSSAPTAPPTRCRRRRPAAKRSSSHPASTSSSRCRAAANAITVRYSIPDAPNGGGITAPLNVTVNGERPGDHDAHVAVRLALQPVPVHQRPKRRPAAPGLVDHRVRAACPAPPPRTRDHQAVPAHALLRRAAPAARPHVPGRRRRSGSPHRRAPPPRGP